MSDSTRELDLSRENILALKSAYDQIFERIWSQVDELDKHPHYVYALYALDECASHIDLVWSDPAAPIGSPVILTVE